MERLYQTIQEKDNLNDSEYGGLLGVLEVTLNAVWRSCENQDDCACGQQARFNLNLLKSKKMKSLEMLVTLEISKYSFHILWLLTVILWTFIR